MSAPSTRLLRKKGATIAVTANADVMFLPGGDVNRWFSRFADLTERRTASAAPSNKRPRWGHYGLPLKRTFRSSRPQTRSVKSGMRLYAAVGSSAPYAAYVDQGTGIYGGRGPYRAKILPPWKRGEPSLYEASWVPPGRAKPLGGVMIKGQKGQEFFEKGLNRAFRTMIRQGDLSIANPVKVGEVLRTWPKGLENFSGATPNDAAFRVSLEEWRAWRDEAFQRGELLGRRTEERKPQPDSPAKSRRKELSADARAEKAKARADKATTERDSGAKSTVKDKPRVSAKTRAADGRDFLNAMIKKYGADKVDRGSLEYRSGRWYVVVAFEEVIEGKIVKGFREVSAKAKT